MIHSRLFGLMINITIVETHEWMNMFFFWREKSSREKKDEKRQLSKNVKTSTIVFILCCGVMDYGV